MKIKYLFLLTAITFIVSCKNKTNSIAPNERVKSFELLNGTYTGTIYRWERDYDSTHTQVIESFDTLYNVTSILEIDEDSNLIKFGGVLYLFHDDLIANANKDTIKGLMQYTTHPYNSIEIIKSQKFVKLVSSAYSSNGGPWAYSQTDEYYKD